MTVHSVPSSIWSLHCELSDNLIESKVQIVAYLQILLKKNSVVQKEVAIKLINVRIAWQVSQRKVLD